MAGKLDESSNQITTTTDIHQKFVDAKNRGGLWNVSSNVIHIFARVELIFRKSTRTFQKKIDSKNLVKDTGVLSDFSKICDISCTKVSNEVSLNLLNHLITLYIRLRSFSYAKEKVQLHKIQATKRKVNSLRKEIKKATSTPDKQV